MKEREEREWKAHWRKQKNGITLITLVVTIVVLSILAGVSINTVVGDDGIIQKAKEAAEATKRASATSVIPFISFVFIKFIPS